MLLNLTDHADPLQIEQFIESIFPSQKTPLDTTSPASVEEAEKKRKEDYETKWDLIYMTTAVVITVLVITSLMVSFNVVLLFSQMLIDYQIFIAWLAGARFDIAYSEAKQQLGELLGWVAPKAVEAVTEVHVTSGKSEL
jgi:farnesyl-diphosphate farnesyltransferase